ncbi:toxin-antitoxin system YwqK family antitoxin [Stutzerimonas zhaodongensis]|uniref:toxin-antitoxin system YwqK family antitoxin n=1 Tax=Stutzerimonas zhaodongensis TaxID=1176257 RepID=UPI0039EE5B67
MAEYRVTTSANLSKVENYEDCRSFLETLYVVSESCDTEKELEAFLASQKCEYRCRDFMWHEYLSAIEDLSIKEEKTFTALFIVGDAAIDFCNELNLLLKKIKAKQIKIELTYDGEQEKIDWESLGNPENISTMFLRKPEALLINGATGHYSLVSRTGILLGKLNIELGHLAGVQTMFNKYGSVLCNTSFKSGIPHGKLKAYYPDGSNMLESTFKEGVLDGPLLAWENNGHVKIRSNYKNGLLHGAQYMHLSTEQKPHLQANYKNGLLNGPAVWRGGLMADKSCHAVFKSGKPSENINDFAMACLETLEDKLAHHESIMMFIDPYQFYELISKHALEQSNKPPSSP